MRRRITQDNANTKNMMLGITSEPVYLLNFAISKNTSLASCIASTTEPTRANLFHNWKRALYKSRSIKLDDTCSINKLYPNWFQGINRMNRETWRRLLSAQFCSSKRISWSNVLDEYTELIPHTQILRQTYWTPKVKQTDNTYVCQH